MLYHKFFKPHFISAAGIGLICNLLCFITFQVLISLTDKETAEVPLIVRRPPIISDNSTRSVVVVEGQTVELKCFASGYPPPEVCLLLCRI